MISSLSVDSSTSHSINNSPITTVVSLLQVLELALGNLVAKPLSIPKKLKIPIIGSLSAGLRNILVGKQIKLTLPELVASIDGKADTYKRKQMLLNALGDKKHDVMVVKNNAKRYTPLGPFFHSMIGGRATKYRIPQLLKLRDKYPDSSMGNDVKSHETLHIIFNAMKPDNHKPKPQKSIRKSLRSGWKSIRNKKKKQSKQSEKTKGKQTQTDKKEHTSPKNTSKESSNNLKKIHYYKELTSIYALVKKVIMYKPENKKRYQKLSKDMYKTQYDKARKDGNNKRKARRIARSKVGAAARNYGFNNIDEFFVAVFNDARMQLLLKHTFITRNSEKYSIFERFRSIATKLAHYSNQKAIFNELDLSMYKDIGIADYVVPTTYQGMQSITFGDDKPTEGNTHTQELKEAV